MASLDPSEIESMPLAAIDVSDPLVHQRDLARSYFRRLRREDPVHYCADSKFGPYWSVTRYADILHVDMNHQTYSSDGTVVLDDALFSGGHIENEVSKTSFIVMDPPHHGPRRSMVIPALSPGNIQKMEAGIRERTRQLLGSLPIGEEFDWVSEVSIELTLRMLAILMGFPFEERHKLLYWSNVQSGAPGDGVVESWEHRSAVMREIAERFTRLLNEKIDAPASADLMSVLASRR